MVCGSFVCIYCSQCRAFEAIGIDACYGLSEMVEGECVNFNCQACDDTYCCSCLPKDDNVMEDDL